MTRAPSQGRRTLLLLLFSASGFALLAYGGLLLKESLKTPEHVHSRDDSAAEVKAERQVRIGRLEGALKNEPSNVAAMTDLAGLYLFEENYAAAQQWYSRARALDGRNVRAITGLASACRLAGDAERAVALLRESIGIDPAFAESWLVLGVVYRFEKNMPDSARWAWGKFLRLEPNGENAERVKSELRAIR